MFRARVKIAQREHNERAWLAWHIVRLGHANPKKFPKLETLQAGAAAKRRQTWQEQMAVMGRWSAVMARVNAQRPKGR